jgi:L-alanine-DL-glutamate epimerase-like enolase superfamily enzyme
VNVIAQPVAEAAVERIEVSAYRVPTDEPESDGTLQWDATTAILVEVHAGGEAGLGYSYGDVSSATFIDSVLSDAVAGTDAMAPPLAWQRMQSAARNAGRVGAGAIAISAVDIALWDLKAKLLGVCLADALPRHRQSVPVYGSGGFCSYSDDRLREQLRGWVDDGLDWVKIKIGRDPDRDPRRLDVARAAIGDDVGLFVDANGAYSRKQALGWAHRLRREWGVSYFEEPVTSEDPEGLRLLRDQGPPGLEIAAGEYGWDLPDLARLVDAGAVDVLQADVTRCGGITNFLRVDGLCKARSLPLSAHCAPAVSVHACCASESIVHVEYFHDHVRLEQILFDGTLSPEGGALEPDRSRPGLGLELKRQDAGRYAVR